MSKIVELLKDQKELELSYIEKLKPTLEAIQNNLVSAIIESIIYDSQKHAALCQALINVEAGSIPHMLDTDIATSVKMSQAIKQHIRVEADMIKKLKSMLKRGDDDRVAYILKNIINDEERHHATLTQISNLIDRDDTTYDEYLELAQKYMFVPPRGN